MRLLDPGVLLSKDIVDTNGTFLLLLNPPRCDNARGIEDAFISNDFHGFLTRSTAVELPKSDELKLLSNR